MEASRKNRDLVHREHPSASAEWGLLTLTLAVARSRPEKTERILEIGNGKLKEIRGKEGTFDCSEAVGEFQPVEKKSGDARATPT